MTARNTPQNFWSHVEFAAGCWEYKGHAIKFGYRRVKWAGKAILAHRLAWIIDVGSLEPGQKVLHRCDNPACVRPSHLFLGTQTDNIADMVAKGRSANRYTHVFVPAPAKPIEVSPAEIEVLLSELRALRSSNEELRKALGEAVDVATWMSGSSSFSPEGEAAEGWEKARPKLDAARSLLVGEPEPKEER